MPRAKPKKKPSWKPQYFSVKPGAKGDRYFWSPGPGLRDAGWPSSRRLAEASGKLGDALEEAKALNAWVKAWKLGAAPGPDQVFMWREGDASPASAEHPPAAGPGGHAPGSLDALIARYKADDGYRKAFKMKKPKTRRSYEDCFKILSRWAGDKEVAAIDSKMVDKFYSLMFPVVPHSTNAAMRVARLLWNYAGRRGESEAVTSNPFEKMGLEAPPKTGRIWPPETVAHFVQVADILGRWSIGTAVTLNEWMGQREGDLLRLTDADLEDMEKTVTQSKGGRQVFLPVDDVPHLAARLAEQRRRRNAAQVASLNIITSETTGQAYSEDNFRHLFADTRRQAADGLDPEILPKGLSAADRERLMKGMPEVAELWFMHLRHTAVVRLFEADCQEAWISAVTGHSLKTVHSIIEHYLVRTRKMARQAFKRRRDAESADAAGAENDG